MNILEFKIHLESTLKVIKEQKNKYDIKGYEISALVNNDVCEEAPSITIQQKANLVFESIAVAKLPIGGTFVVFNLKKAVGFSTPLESVIKQIDEMLNKTPLNAPITFKIENEVAFLTTMAGGIISDGKDYYGKLFIQFITKESLFFKSAAMSLIQEFGFKPQIDKKVDYFNFM